jgi:malate dehydrogenase (oxaloacetate-decarboxylating)
VGDIITADRTGILEPKRSGLDVSKRWMADHTNRDGGTGALRDALRGADVFIGVSGPDVITPSDLATMARDPIVFAMANPDPEVDPIAAREYAAVVATGRSDYPNQINNVLAFPGVFRGALDARATAITEDMKVAAARALADVITPEQLRPTYIVPSPFNEHVVEVVAQAVRDQAKHDQVVIDPR